jgi:hypothetical protein
MQAVDAGRGVLNYWRVERRSMAIHSRLAMRTSSHSHSHPADQLLASPLASAAPQFIVRIPASPSATNLDTRGSLPIRRDSTQLLGLPLVADLQLDPGGLLDQLGRVLGVLGGALTQDGDHGGEGICPLKSANSRLAICARS